MEFKGTKGEWEMLNHNTDKKWFNITSKKGVIGRCFYGEIHPVITSNEAEFNAKLFIAAPELLNFAIQFISAIDNEEIIIQENCDNEGYENCGGRLYELAQKTVKKTTE